MTPLTCFAVLTHDNSGSYYASPRPGFLVLALLMEMEQEERLRLSSGGNLEVCSKQLQSSKQLLADFIQKNGLTSVKAVLDFFLRKTTYNDLKSIVNAVMDSLCSQGFTEKVNGKYITSDEVMHKANIAFVMMLSGNTNRQDGIIAATLLYGCRLLNKYLDKNEYKSTVALIKNGVCLEKLPLTSFILDNIDLIRGHIMGIVAN